MSVACQIWMQGLVPFFPFSLFASSSRVKYQFPPQESDRAVAYLLREQEIDHGQGEVVGSRLVGCLSILSV